MAVWLVSLGVICLQISSAFGIIPPSCPHLAATFILLVDQPIDGPSVSRADPELTFFREIMGFRDEDIQHFYEDAMKYFNETYGLDFSQSDPNDQREQFFENAILRPVRFLDEIDFRVVFNNWIRSGNTGTSCGVVHAGELAVSFVGDQLLRGTYGGEDGIGAGPLNYIYYGYNRIDICEQSPVILQYQSAVPLRLGPDGLTPIAFDVYNNVLGRGKALGAFTLDPDPNNPGKLRYVNPVVYSFPGN